MNARWYAPGLGRFLSADTIVPNPGNSQAYNRFSYVRNNPIRFNDPTGHRDCEFDESCGALPELPHEPKTVTFSDPYEPPEDLITHLPLDRDDITWQSGFGPNFFADETCNQSCYPQSHNIHTGLDFGATYDEEGVNVYATVSGRVVAIFPGDADPNVVIAVEVGDLTYYVVHGHVISSVEVGQEVSAGDLIGVLEDQGGNTHVHLGLRLDPNIENRAYNPLLFMDPELTVGMSFVSEDLPYYGNESPTSIRSFLYGTGSFFDAGLRPTMGIVR